MKVEITGPDQFTQDEILTIKELCEDWGWEYNLKADPDKVEALIQRLKQIIGGWND